VLWVEAAEQVEHILRRAQHDLVRDYFGNWNALVSVQFGLHGVCLLLINGCGALRLGENYPAQVGL
jgi:hypothetical protein